MFRWLFLLSCIVLLSVTNAGAQQVEDVLEKIAGTLDVSSQPYLSSGQLIGCQLVFDALTRDYAYRKGKFLKVSGSVGIMMGDNRSHPAAIVKIVASEVPDDFNSANTPSAPSRAYLIGDGYETNLGSLVSAQASDIPGGLFSIFQITPTLDMVIAGLSKGSITFAFNQLNGKTDIRLPIELDVVSTDPTGQRQHSEKITQDFAGCLQALIK